MGVLDRILSGTRDVLLLQYKVEQLTQRVDRLADGHDALRERVIRIEVLISEAQRAAGRRLPSDQSR